jgi:hypothetical protein
LIVWHTLWSQEERQDVAEGAIMIIAVILVILTGTIQLIAAHADHVFSRMVTSISRR